MNGYFPMVASYEWCGEHPDFAPAAPDLTVTCRTLLDYLIETHADEVAANHNGDDSVCSYCTAIANATSELRAMEGGAA